MDRMHQLQLLLKENPKDAFLRFAIAKEWEKLDNWSEAIALYEDLRADQPDYIGLYYHLGKAYERLQQTHKARFIYTIGQEEAKKGQHQHALTELIGALNTLDMEN